jgi:hypothetical protein
MNLRSSFIFIVSLLLSLKGLSQSVIVFNDSTRMTVHIQSVDNFVVYPDSLNAGKTKKIGVGRVSYIINPDGTTNKLGKYSEKELNASGSRLYKNALRLSFFGPAQDMLEIRYERAAHPGISFLASAGVIGITPSSRVGEETTGSFFTLSGRLYDKGYCRPGVIKNKKANIGSYLQTQVGYEAYSSEVLYLERFTAPLVSEKILGPYRVNAVTATFGGGILANITSKISADIGLALGYAIMYDENISHTVLPETRPFLHHTLVTDDRTKFVVNWTFQIGYNF